MTPDSDAQMAALGLVRVRELYQMRRSLPLPDDLLAGARPIEVRAFRPGVDDDGFLRVNNRAFSWHPEQSDWGPEQLAARMAEPWFDADGFLIHESLIHESLIHKGPETDGPESLRIDGFCWTKIHPATPEDPALGEIYVIAADPDTRGTGLGRALTVAGLRWLAAAGLQVAMLYTEADNAPAVSLYERLGFVVHHSDAAYAPADAAP
jgi:mycothiol synthase